MASATSSDLYKEFKFLSNATNTKPADNTKKIAAWTSLSKLSNSSQLAVGMYCPGVAHKTKIKSAHAVLNSNGRFTIRDQYFIVLNNQAPIKFLYASAESKPSTSDGLDNFTLMIQPFP